MNQWFWRISCPFFVNILDVSRNSTNRNIFKSISYVSNRQSDFINILNTNLIIHKKLWYSIIIKMCFGLNCWFLPNSGMLKKLYLYLRKVLTFVLFPGWVPKKLILTFVPKLDSQFQLWAISNISNLLYL